jgi:hypothetical protein
VTTRGARPPGLALAALLLALPCAAPALAQRDDRAIDADRPLTGLVVTVEGGWLLPGSDRRGVEDGPAVLAGLDWQTHPGARVGVFGGVGEGEVASTPGLDDRITQIGARLRSQVPRLRFSPFIELSVSWFEHDYSVEEQSVESPDDGGALGWGGALGLRMVLSSGLEAAIVGRFQETGNSGDSIRKNFWTLGLQLGVGPFFGQRPEPVPPPPTPR